jgi:hypothetical protein
VHLWLLGLDHSVRTFSEETSTPFLTGAVCERVFLKKRAPKRIPQVDVEVSDRLQHFLDGDHPVFWAKLLLLSPQHRILFYKCHQLFVSAFEKLHQGNVRKQRVSQGFLAI